MPERIEILITGDARKAISELKRTGTEFKRFDKEADKAGRQTQSFTGELRSLGGQLAGGLALGAVVSGLAAYTKEAFMSAAASERLEASTNRLGSRYSLTADDIVDSVKMASGFTISRFDAMRSANLALLGRIIDSQDEMAKLTQIAVTLGRATGINATQALNRFTEAIVKNETELLDEFGLIVRQRDAYDMYAATLGKTANQLTQTEKSQAFANAVIAAGTERMVELGGVTNDTLADLERTSASAQDFTASMGELIIALGGSINVFGFVNESLTLLTEGAEAWTFVLSEALPAIMGDKEALDALNTSTQENTKLQEQAAAATSLTIEEIQAQEQAARDLTNTQASFFNQMSQLQERAVEREAEHAARVGDIRTSLNEKTRQGEEELSNRLSEIERERAAAIAEAQTNSLGQSAAFTQAQIDNINRRFDEERTTAETHNQEMITLERDRANEQLQILAEQQAEERRMQEEQLKDLKTKLILNKLETTGELERLTGGFSNDADETFQAIRAGLIPVNKDLFAELALGGAEMTETYEVAQNVAETSARRIDEAFQADIATLKRLEQQAQRTARFLHIGRGGSDFKFQNGNIVPARASGGPIFAGQDTLVGENGPELIRSQSNAMVIPNVTNNFNLTTNSAMPSAGLQQDFAMMEALAT